LEQKFTKGFWMRTQELKGLFGKKYDIVCNMTRPVIYKTHIYRNDCNCCWATLQNRHLLCGWAKLENGDIVSVLQHCNWIENLCIVIHILLWVCRAPHNRKKREHFAVLRVATVFVNLFLYFLGGGELRVHSMADLCSTKIFFRVNRSWRRSRPGWSDCFVKKNGQM
jgi:hypothetical protein